MEFYFLLALSITYPAAAGHLFNFSNLEQCYLYTFINQFHFDSVSNLQNRTRQYFCMNYIDHAYMHKCPQNSTKVFKFLPGITLMVLCGDGDLQLR